MTDTISPIIQPAELLGIYQAENLVIVDASNGKNARANYEAKHLKGALFVDLNTQLADIKEDLADGGRHPLPGIERFAATLTELGITKERHVVVYDDKQGANAAARFWWMLKAAGHRKVQVLNGGLQEAERKGLPLSTEISIPTPSQTYPFKEWVLPLADMNEVEKVSEDPNHLVIDVRDSERYNGTYEPIDLVAEHIPGAVNVPFTNNLDENGLFLLPDKLKAQYQRIFGETQPEHIIVHCGSGVTACHTILAIAYAGLEIPKLYVGSWSEWSRNHKPVVA